MNRFRWRLACFASRWRHRLRYLLRAPFVYRNWWALPLPKVGVGVVLELRDGLRYLIRAGTTDLAVVNEAAVLNPYFDPKLFPLPEDAVVMDVGANIGDVTMQLARACPRGRVFAVEPVSEHARMIGLQTLLNGAENVTCLQMALGGHEGEVAIRLDGSGSSIAPGHGKTEKVRVTTLPQVMGELGVGRLDLLKLDCEGAEWDILPAAEVVLPRIQRICMEFHCSRGWTGEKLASWLRDRGYDVRHTAGSWNGMLWAIRARDPAA
jgi:FkbM family methyltransferase